jgi:hypothetical protein
MPIVALLLALTPSCRSATYSAPPPIQLTSPPPTIVELDDLRDFEEHPDGSIALGPIAGPRVKEALADYRRMPRYVLDRDAQGAAYATDVMLGEVESARADERLRAASGVSRAELFTWVGVAGAGGLTVGALIVIILVATAGR